MPRALVTGGLETQGPVHTTRCSRPQATPPSFLLRLSRRKLSLVLESSATIIPTSRSWVTWLPPPYTCPQPRGQPPAGARVCQALGKRTLCTGRLPSLQPSEAETGTPSIDEETEVQDIFLRLSGPVRGTHEDWCHISVSPEPLGQWSLYYQYTSPDVPILHCDCHSHAHGPPRLVSCSW